MSEQRIHRLITDSLFVLLLLMGASGTARSQDWAQWGGPDRNFKSGSKGLASSWPEKGPRQLWSRELGEGYSAISAEGGRLYTMYRKGDQEVVIALEASTGKTVWEYTDEAPLTGGMMMEHGPGPHSTPLVVADRVYTTGVTGKLHCLDKRSGKVIWFHDLYKEFGGAVHRRGYACSPLAYKSAVIVTVGGPGQALMAFNQRDGIVVWKNQDFAYAPASPIVIRVDGQDQLVGFMSKEIVGVDPNNGELLWSHPHVTDYGLNISTPVWGEDNILFCSSAYSGGSRALKLSRKDGKTTAEELWFHRRLRVHHGTVIRVGDYLYGSSGDFGPAFLTALEVKTGKIVWQDRRFSKASFLYVDGKFIVLDEDGNLALATMSPEGLNVHSKVELLKRIAWTVPTLVGTRLYVRDRKSIMALELG